MPVKIDSSAGLFRKLPSVDELQRNPELVALASKEGQAAVTDAARAVLATLRQEIAAGWLDGNGVDLALSGIEDAVTLRVRQALQHSLRSVINATGVILHTNLGRAPLAASTLEYIRETAGAYSNLEFDLETGERGKRDVHVDRLFRKLLDEALDARVDAARPRQWGQASDLHYRRQQQRRGGSTRAQHAGGKRRSHRLSWRTR